MTRLRRVTVITFAVALVPVITQPQVGAGAQIRILCSNGIKSVMQELVPQFEHMTSHQIFVAYSVAADLKRGIDTGESFDIAVLTPALIDDAINQGHIASNTRIILARAPMAIAVRTGSAKADISTIDAFKKALLTSKSIAYAREGATGVFFADLVQRLGISDSLKPKTILTPTGDEVSTAVLHGDAELGVLPTSEIVSVQGLNVLGTLPADIGGYVTMVAGISSRSTQRQIANELIQFLISPASADVLKRKGMERP